jgi:DinB family protein
MNAIQFRSFSCALTMLAVIAAAPAVASAQTANVQTALANDVGTLSDKFVGLARVMAGKYDWKPSQGVRSVGEVFNLIVNENRMLAGLLTGAGAPGGGGGGGGRGNQVSDPAEMQEALRSSYAALKQAVSGLSDEDLKATVKMFGRETTKQGAALMLIFDQHEHLGQSIAYARSNNIVPPWSK